MKNKVTYKRFLNQIVYLSKKKGLKAKKIRQILIYSNSKRVVPSTNVTYPLIS